MKKARCPKGRLAKSPVYGNYCNSGVTVMRLMLSSTPSPVASALLWIILIVAAPYLTLNTAHRSMQATAHTLHSSFNVENPGGQKRFMNDLDGLRQGNYQPEVKNLIGPCGI